jgi:hypothetical protein
MATVETGTLPFCCGVKVAGHAIVPSDQGAEELCDAIRAVANPRVCGAVLYTTTTTQKREYQALQMAGFNILGKFKNPRTGNWVLLWGWLKSPLPSRTRTVRGPRAAARPAMAGGLRATARSRSTSRRRLARR